MQPFCIVRRQKRTHEIFSKIETIRTIKTNSDVYYMKWWGDIEFF